MSHLIFDSLVARLHKHVLSHPDQVALVLPNGNLVQFCDLIKKVELIRQRLRSSGFCPGDRVLVFLPVSEEMIYLLLAFFSEGLVPVLIDPRLGKNHWKSIFAKTGIVAIVSTRKILRLRWLCWWFRKYQLFSIDSEAFDIQRLSIEGEYSDLNISRPHKSQAMDEVLVTLTSGTTGAPKALSRKFEILISQQSLACKYLPTLDLDIHLSLYGVALLQSLIQGATTVLCGERSPESICRQILQHQVTRLSIPPRELSALLVYCEASRIRLDSLKNILTGGAPIPRWLMNKVLSVFPGVRLDLIYGSTECEPICQRQIDQKFLRNVQSPGYPVGSLISELQFSSRFFGHVAGKKIFELILSGPNCVDSPWATGDLVYLDEANEMYLVGRVSEVIQNIPVGIIEESLERLEEIRRVAVIERQNRIIVCIELHQRKSKILASFEECRRRVQDFGLRSFELKVFESLPVDARHGWKIQKKEIRI